VHVADYVLEDQPDWSTELDAGAFTCYYTRTGNMDEGGFLTALAFDAKTGIM